MSIYIQNMTDAVTVVDGDLPLNQQQIDRLVTLILQRLEEKERQEKMRLEATCIRSQALPSRFNQ